VTGEPRKAAIKLLAASSQAESRLAIWTRTASLSHPHLVRILGTGRAEVDEAEVVYAVTELAEEVLAQIIPERPLTADETREMIGPILDALAYLHGNGYVHGRLKPSNVLVIDNEVKLSSDGLLAIGGPAGDVFSNEIHNAPELASGYVTPAADIWSLGVTLVEALTQQQPIWDAATDAEAQVPASLPRPFAEIVQKCLQTDPARRCTLEEIRALLDGKPLRASLPVIESGPHTPHHPHRIADRTAPAKVPLIPLIVGFVLLVAIMIGLRMRSHSTKNAPVQSESTQQAPPAEPESRAAPEATSPSAGSPAEVIDRVMPDVPRSASGTIHGKVSVVVRVDVNETGTVSNAELSSRGPSAYFARLALESARNWKFKPAQQNGRAVASAWTLRYEFRRDGTDVKPAQSAP
jgi:TonB family protein